LPNIDQLPHTQLSRFMNEGPGVTIYRPVGPRSPTPPLPPEEVIPSFFVQYLFLAVNSVEF